MMKVNLSTKTVTLAPSGATAVEDNTFLMKGISVFPNPAVKFIHSKNSMVTGM